MNKCARCDKAVYPMEKLYCLDKVWHNSCFRCKTCNAQLTMKNYKGYNKEPYCGVHYPTIRFTAVSDTPEYKRLAAMKSNKAKLDNVDLTKKSESTVFDQVSTVSEPNISLGQQESITNLLPENESSDQPTHTVPIQDPEFASEEKDKGMICKALYDYSAADGDEVSFNEGDMIIQCEHIDDGWMTGTVERTGMNGMIPSGYVEEA